MTVATLPIPVRISRQVKRRANLKPSEWAEKFRVVAEGPLVGEADYVPWSNDIFPPGVDIMDASERFRRVLMLASPQRSGKTALMVNVALKKLHWNNQDIMYVHANADKGESQYEKKFHSSITKSPRLDCLIPDNRDDIGTRRERKYTNGCSAFVTGSESEADLSGSTAPNMFFDDVHAMPPQIGTHGHAVEFGEMRSASFPPEDRVSVIAGQASDVDNWLWKQLITSAFYVLYLPCLKCGMFQVLDWTRFVFDGTNVESALADCYMKCYRESCKHEIRHEELSDMLHDYRWISSPPGVNPVMNLDDRGGLASLDDEKCYPDVARPTQDAGFWWNAYSWPLEPWTNYAADWVSAQGKPTELKTFQQQVRVIPWQEEELDEERLTEDEISSHSGGSGYHADTVPAESDLVITTVDIQSGYIYYLNIAWRKSDGTSWVISMGTFGKPIRGKSEKNIRQRRIEGITDGLDEVNAMITQGWPVMSIETGESVGNNRSSTFGLIDVGFEPDIVGNWWSVHRGTIWRMIRGQRAGGNGSMWPRTPQKDKRGRLFRIVNVNQAKHLLRRLQRVNKGQPGYQYLPDDGIHQNTLRAYYRHMTSEVFNKNLATPRWDTVDERGRPVKGRANHFWDCWTYQVIAAYACGVKMPEIESEKRPAVTVTNQKVEPTRTEQRSTWKIGR